MFPAPAFRIPDCAKKVVDNVIKKVNNTFSLLRSAPAYKNFREEVDFFQRS